MFDVNNLSGECGYLENNGRREVQSYRYFCLNNLERYSLFLVLVGVVSSTKEITKEVSEISMLLCKVV